VLPASFLDMLVERELKELPAVQAGPGLGLAQAYRVACPALRFRSFMLLAGRRRIGHTWR